MAGKSLRKEPLFFLASLSSGEVAAYRFTAARRALHAHLVLARWNPWRHSSASSLHRQETAGYSRWALNASAEVIPTELEAETQRPGLC